MTRCLDEAKLQCYFDGELPLEMLKSVTSHLASCAVCAAMARELEEESALVMSALAPEFETAVPTERLRERIDAVVLGERLAAAKSQGRTNGLAAFFAGLFNFGTQRTYGLASLAVVIVFASIFAVVKTRTATPPAQADPQPGSSVAARENKNLAPAPREESLVPETGIQQSTNSTLASRQSQGARYVKYTPNRAASKPTPPPVKLLPGERAYLQTIAKLDSTIKSNKKSMRPALQVEYERNLAVVDRAIAATRSAAKSNPSDPDAADFMFAAYQSKVDLLNTIADARVGGGRGH